MNITLGGRLLTFVAGSLILIAAYASRQCANLTATSESWKSSYESETKSAKFWRSKEGLSQGEKKAAYVTINVLKEQHRADLEALTKENIGLKKNLKNLQSVTAVSSTTTNVIKTVLHDTTILEVGPVPGRSFAYSDKWYTVSGYFLLDEINISSQSRDSIAVVQLWKRDGPPVLKWFKQQELYTEVINYNPNSTLTGIRSTIVRPPPRRRFGIVVFAGADVFLKPTIGIGIGYNLINF